MRKLERTNFLILTEDEREILNNLIVDNSQALEMANIYTDVLSRSLSAFAIIIANNQVEALKRLSALILSLGLPLLIYSFYGMNTPIPFRDSPYSFWIPVCISFIILIVAAVHYYYKFNRQRPE